LEEELFLAFFAEIIHYLMFMRNCGSRLGRLCRKVAGLAILCTLSTRAASTGGALRPLRADKPPVIDGKLDDAIWQTVQPLTGFKTYAPDYGKDMSEQTEAYVAYDSENLYFAFRCYDNEPDKIKAAITSRDNNRSDDWVCINLDSFNDQQALYCFYSNPFGIQSDSRFVRGNEDLAFDAVWYSAGRIDEKGYTIEMQIPLKSIRYSDQDPVEMAVVFERRISRRSEQGTYPPLSPERAMAFLTQTMPMEFRGLKHYTLLELLPAWTYSQKYNADQGNLAINERKGDGSLTAKYGITSDLIFDGTYNPDFSQVEADAGQVDVNLRYNLFYPEKRPFFLEGRENFTVGATAASALDPVQSIVHTRTIVNPLTGIKLTGQVSKGNRIATIYAMDELPPEESSQFGSYAHFLILRYKRALREDSYIGALYTGREMRGHFNRVGGIDGLSRLTESSILEYNGLLSLTKTDAASSQVGGHTLGLHYSYSTRDVDYDASFKSVSENFAAEAGYITRTGILGFTGLARPKFYPPSQTFRRIQLELFTGQTQDRFSRLWETANYVSLSNLFPGNMSLKAKYSYSTEVFLGTRFQTGGFQATGSGLFTKQINVSLSYTNGKAIYYSTDPYQGRSTNATASLIYQPSDQLSGEFSFVYSNFFRDSDGERIYDYPIGRVKLTYQLNKYLFFRGITEYNKFKRQLLTDFLASFTYIPGTVVHFGYGSLYQRVKWENNSYVANAQYLETQRAFFFKMSYLWRM
jgi:hypothetical protein